MRSHVGSTIHITHHWAILPTIIIQMATAYYPTGGSSHVYFFYDCEASGPSIREDRIIEMAAVLYTKNLEPLLTPKQLARLNADTDHFQSLCFTTHKLDQFVIDVVGLTLPQLRYAPLFPRVMEQFLVWIGKKQSEVETATRRRLTPVLVAHSGISHDFPRIMRELEQIKAAPLFPNYSRVASSVLKRFYGANLHFADTFLACKLLQEHSSPIMSGVKKLSVQALWEHFFPDQHFAAHRALGDAQALCKLFTESPLSGAVNVELQETIQTDLAVHTQMLKKDKVRELKDVGITHKKAVQMVEKGVSLEDLEKHSRSGGEHSLIRYLATFGITSPKYELLDYFSQNRW